MPNALLDVDQCPQESMLSRIFSHTAPTLRTPPWEPQSLRESYTLAQRGRFNPVTPIDRSGKEGTAIDAHFSDGRRVLGELKRAQARNSEVRRFQSAMRWLSENRSRYQGLWIALDGEKLLAADASATQVFSEVGNLNPVPLVIRVEEEETPFAGW